MAERCSVWMAGDDLAMIAGSNMCKGRRQHAEVVKDDELTEQSKSDFT